MAMSFLALQHPIGPHAGQAMGALAALRAPPFLPAALFETHWTWWLAALAFGTGLLLLGRQRGEQRFARAGLVVFAVTALWIVAAFAFDTATERLYKAHQTLAAATEKGDVGTIVSYLDAGFVADTGELGTVPINHENAQQILGEILKQTAPREIHITTYRVDKLVSGDAVTHITVIANINDVGPTKSQWQITWADVPGEDWRMTRMGPEARGTRP